jgi:hypothetical protein
MPPRRALKATPSNAGDLCDFQRQLLSDVKLLHDDLREKRQPFLEVAQTYAKSFCQDRSVMRVDGGYKRYTIGDYINTLH